DKKAIRGGQPENHLAHFLQDFLLRKIRAQDPVQLIQSLKRLGLFLQHADVVDYLLLRIGVARGDRHAVDARKHRSDLPRSSHVNRSGDLFVLVPDRELRGVISQLERILAYAERLAIPERMFLYSNSLDKRPVRAVQIDQNKPAFAGSPDDGVFARDLPV